MIKLWKKIDTIIKVLSNHEKRLNKLEEKNNEKSNHNTSNNTSAK